MKLTDWIAREEIKRFDFAKRIGISPTSLTHICLGRQWVGPEVARAIERETRGEVTVADLLAGYEGRRERVA